MTKLFITMVAGVFALSAMACDGTKKKEEGQKKRVEVVTQIQR